MGGVYNKDEQLRDDLIAGVIDLFDPGTENHMKQINKLAEIFTLARIESEKLKEERDNPVIRTCVRGGIIHEIRKRDVDNFIMRSPNYRNIRLDMLSG